MSVAAEKIAVELFPGVVGLIKNDISRPVKVLPKNWITYNESVAKVNYGE